MLIESLDKNDLNSSGAAYGTVTFIYEMACSFSERAGNQPNPAP